MKADKQDKSVLISGFRVSCRFHIVRTYTAINSVMAMLEQWGLAWIPMMYST